MIENLVSAKFRQDFSDTLYSYRKNARRYIDSRFESTKHKRWAMERYFELRGYSLALYRGEHISSKKYKTILSEIEIIKDSMYESARH